jgi:hypothetical protein
VTWWIWVIAVLIVIVVVWMVFAPIDGKRTSKKP